jgi:hypothetical protein
MLGMRRSVEMCVESTNANNTPCLLSRVVIVCLDLHSGRTSVL